VSPWKVILATMVIFVCGIITGAMVTRVAETKTEPALVVATMSASNATPASVRPMPAAPVFQLQRGAFLKTMEKQLDLSAEQREQIGKIMKASQERTQPLWNQIAPEMTDELKHVREDIRGVLTPEQRKKFVELLKHNRKAEAAPSGNGRSSRSSETTTSGTSAL
jgi:Spy/CpxP family protein refolding chaperone